MCRVIAVSNQKGGVGKTVSCVNIGVGLAQMGKKVLLIDGDPQGDLTISLGVEEPDEIEYSLVEHYKIYLRIRTVNLHWMIV